MSTANNIFTAFSFISLILVLIPFPWHLKARNVGTCLFVVWTALGLLPYFINSIIWRDNTTDYVAARIWCDITTRIVIGLSVGIPAAGLCISRTLYSILLASAHSVTRTDKEKFRDAMIDLAIGVGVPVVAMGPLYYIVQGHRFDIFEEVGCYPVVVNIPAGYLAITILPLIIGLISASYSVRTIIVFRKRRAELRENMPELLNRSNYNFIRFMTLSASEIICCVPLNIVIIVLNITVSHVDPSWMSWKDIHSNFSRIGQYSSSEWRQASHNTFEISRWLVVGCGLLFFGLFGISVEAKNHYKPALSSISKYLSHTINGSTKVGPSAGSKEYKEMLHGAAFRNVNYQVPGPVTAIDEEVIKRRDSLDLFPQITSMKEAKYDHDAELDVNTALPFDSESLKRFSAIFSVKNEHLNPEISFFACQNPKDLNADKV